MTEDITQIDFPFVGRRRVRAAFDADPISSDGGAILLRQVDRRIGLLDAIARLGVHFLVGISTNKRLKAMAAALEEKARRRFLRTRKKARLLKTVRYRALKRWPRSDRVIIKCEHSELGKNTRFVVTSVPGRADEFYDWYAERGESSENSIKDLKRALKADRLSCHRFLANQFRLFLHATAYVLMYELRRAAKGTRIRPPSGFAVTTRDAHDDIACSAPRRSRIAARV